MIKLGQFREGAREPVSGWRPNHSLSRDPFVQLEAIVVGGSRQIYLGNTSALKLIFRICFEFVHLHGPKNTTAHNKTQLLSAVVGAVGCILRYGS